MTFKVADQDERENIEQVKDWGEDGDCGGSGKGRGLGDLALGIGRDERKRIRQEKLV